MYEPKDLGRVPSIRHGCTYESIAIQKFSEITGKEVDKSGFCLHPDFPYLGASPDGFIKGEEAVVEVKCPYMGRKSKIAPGKNFPFLEYSGGNIQIKRTNNYYYQIVGQMKLAQKKEGYFVVYTHEDLFYEKIILDDDLFMNTMLPKLKAFYDQHYCPYVASVLKK